LCDHPWWVVGEGGVVGCEGEKAGDVVGVVEGSSALEEGVFNGFWLLVADGAGGVVGVDGHKCGDSGVVELYCEGLDLGMWVVMLLAQMVGCKVEHPRCEGGACLVGDM